MARVSKGPRYEASKRRWVANLGGEKTILVRDCNKTDKEAEKKALEMYQDLADARRVETDGDRGPVWAVLNAWLLWLKNREDPPPLAPNSYEIAERIVNSFCGLFREVPVRELRPTHFNQWLKAMKDPSRTDPRTGRKLAWSPGYCKMAMDKMKAAFAWASTVGGLIKNNPFRVPGAERLRPKQVKYRSNKVAIEKEEHRLLLEHALRQRHRGFACLLMFLRATGARPAEIHQAKASEWDEDKLAFVIQTGPEQQGRYKLNRFGKARTVYVPGYLIPLARELMRRYPEGPIFRHRGGRPWSVGAIDRRFKTHIRSINKRAGREVIREAVVSYSYRHAYVTEWLQAGKSMADLATFLDTSTAMIEKHYSHLTERRQHLREAMESFETVR